MLRLKEQFGSSDSVVFHSCHRRLRFGNDIVFVVNLRVLVLVCISGHHVVLSFYVAPGCTIAVDYQ